MTFSCIFDWDGIIIDSSEHHIEGWRRLAKEEHLVFPEHLFKQSFGMKNEEIIPQLWKWTNDISEIRRIDRKKEAIYRDIMREKGLTALPGVASLLMNSRNAGFRVPSDRRRHGRILRSDLSYSPLQSTLPLWFPAKM